MGNQPPATPKEVMDFIKELFIETIGEPDESYIHEDNLEVMEMVIKHWRSKFSWADIDEEVALAKMTEEEVNAYSRL